MTTPGGAAGELLAVARELLRHAAEERHQQQMESQREEFQRWLDDCPGLGGRIHEVAETLRGLLGNGLAELVDHVEDRRDDLIDSEFTRSEFLDRHGSALGQLASLYSVAKRLSLVEKSRAAGD
jgi:hypothetical protein